MPCPAETVITAEHPVTAAIRADLIAREALAELAADGMLIAAGSGALGGSDEMERRRVMGGLISEFRRAA